MRCLLLVGLALLATASGYVAPSFVEVDNVGYHQRVGIPEAERIRALEDRILSSRENKIVGGVVAPVNAHSYLAGLIINFSNIAGQSVCGSSLLTANRLVTAAHCWFDGVNQARQFTVVMGSQFLFSGGTRIATTQVVMHPQWVPSTLRNDIAMIYLPTNVLFTGSIQPVSLPSTLDLNSNFAGLTGTAAGYGRTSDQVAGISANAVISQVNLQVITVAQCQATFGTFAQASNICTNGAGGVGICGGDSGGPLTIVRNGQRVLVGVSSFVAAAGCQLGFPSSFARVTSFYGFITQHLF